MSGQTIKVRMPPVGLVLSGAATTAAIIAVRLPRAVRPKSPIAMAFSILTAGAVVRTAMTSAQTPLTLRKGMAEGAGVLVMLLAVLPSGQRLQLLQNPVCAALTALLFSAHLTWSSYAAAKADRSHLDSFRGHAEAILKEFVPSTIARFAAAELTVMRYAFAFRNTPQATLGAKAFSYTNNGVVILIWTVAGLSFLEAGFAHVLLTRWSHTGAIVFTGLSELTVLYLAGIANSLRRLPILLDDSGIRVRLGFLVDHRLAWDAIQSADLIQNANKSSHSRSLRLSGVSSPNVRIHLVEKTVISRLFKGNKTTSAIDIYLDEPTSFLADVAKGILEHRTTGS